MTGTSGDGRILQHKKIQEKNGGENREEKNDHPDYSSGDGCCGHRPFRMEYAWERRPGSECHTAECGREISGGAGL